MKSIELFAGIGGISLAAQWAGIETVAFCEKESFCQKVLKKNWPNVPIFDDICTLNRQVLEEKGVIQQGGTIDIISGGYPCQPFSNPGKRRGEADHNYLWPEVKRLLEELRPTWFIGENVAGHITLGLDTVLHDLENIGYSWQSFVIPAAAVGANHERFRVFIVAYSNSKSEFQTDSEISSVGEKRKAWKGASCGIRREISRTHWQTYRSPVCGMDDGIPKGLDKSRLIALGNAVVPQQIYPILNCIKVMDKTTFLNK